MGKKLSFTVKDGLGLNNPVIKVSNGDEIVVTGMSYKDTGKNRKDLRMTPEMTDHYTEDFELTGVGGKKYLVTREVTIFDPKAKVKGGRFKSEIKSVSLIEGIKIKRSVNSVVNNILSGTPVREALGMFGEDDSFFTKEELLEFASDVVDEVNDYYKSVNSPFNVDYTGAWVEDDDKTVMVDFVCFPNETNYSISVKVDMHSIMSPNDLFKYVPKMAEELKKQISAEEVIESKSIFESTSYIKEAFAAYTGGGIWLFYGQLKNGNWFLTDDFGATLILDADPSDLDESTYQEWQDEHKIKELSGKELEKFDDALLDKLLSYPSNDYKHTGGMNSTEIDAYRKYFKSI